MDNRNRSRSHRSSLPVILLQPVISWLSVCRSPPTVSLSVSPTNVANDGSTTLTWTSNNADSCTASGGWSGSRSTTGSSIESSLTANKTYIVTCSGAGGIASDSVNVTVANSETSAQCTPLLAPSGNIITVNPSQVQQLPGIVTSANQGDNILLEDGTYDLNGSVLWFSTPGVTLRSSSGNPEAVILDGSYSSTELVTLPLPI